MQTSHKNLMEMRKYLCSKGINIVSLPLLLFLSITKHPLQKNITTNMIKYMKKMIKLYFCVWIKWFLNLN